MKLVIANKNYSSWSLRPWLLLKHAGVPFEEEKLSFNDPEFKARVRRYSPVGKVPVLVDGDVVVWDSLAISEYVAERHPEARLWPEDAAARARARSICAEMHSGFAAMRNHMGMNCELSLPGVLFDRNVQADIARVLDIWRSCREAHEGKGPFLFGRFSVADAFFAPITRRFVTYGTPLPAVAKQYVDTISGLPAMREWLAEALAENDFVLEDEPYRTARGQRPVNSIA
jgi:glutathione S-transferase